MGIQMELWFGAYFQEFWLGDKNQILYMTNINLKINKVV